MALYISESRRRRRIVVTAAIVGAVALVVGFLIGRQQVPSVDERVDSVRSTAVDIATGLERLEIEYEQVKAGTDDLQSSVLVPLDDLRADLQGAMDDAPWVTAAQRAEVLDEIAGVREAASSDVSADDLNAQLLAAAAKVRLLFGVEGE